MKLPLAYNNDPVLRKKAARVEQIDDELRTFIADMIETMQAVNGIGLAAPQVHRSIAVFITCVPFQKMGRWHPGKVRVYINPQLLSASEEKVVDGEGCLSIPHIIVPVARPTSVQIQGTDIDGKLFEDTLTGLFAANFLHENDHLNGILITDYLDEESRKAIVSLMHASVKTH